MKGWGLGFIGSIFIFGLAHGAEIKSANVLMYGVLQDPPPCTLNNGGNIEVDFGDKVGVDRVDGINYRTSLDYKITCEDAASIAGNTGMKLTLTAPDSGFDIQAIQTDVDFLGIRIYASDGHNDKVMAPGSVLKITAGNPPLLTAVPVKKPGVTLPEGPFEATATLSVEYQ